MGACMGCYIWYSKEGPGRAPCPLLAVPNVIAHPPTAIAPVTVFLYDGPLLCGCNVTIKRLSDFSEIAGFVEVRLERYIILKC